MKNATLSRDARLTTTQKGLLRSELLRERTRLPDHDPRSHAFADALRRLDEGTYGVCLGCARPVPYARLSVMPETRFCVACGARA